MSLIPFILLQLSPTACGMQRFFYILNSAYYPNIPANQLLPNLVANTKSIDYIIPQAYTITEKGEVKGHVETKLLNFAKQHALKVMPLITNIRFDQTKASLFLKDLMAQNNAIQTILNECKQFHYVGVQFDFEGIAIEDKNALTAFYKQASKVLHDNHFVVTIAVVPQTNGSFSSAFLTRKYKNWSGAYDLKAYNAIADYVSIMSYDQHSRGTTPGPTAGYSWVESTIQYTLHYLPPVKILLGIPVYSTYWATFNRSGKKDGKISANLTELSYSAVQQKLARLHQVLHWDPIDKMNFAFFANNWLYEYLFIEDGLSFNAKLSLVKKYNLAGIAVFNLGNEDPNIWRQLN